MLELAISWSYNCRHYRYRSTTTDTVYDVRTVENISSGVTFTTFTVVDGTRYAVSAHDNAYCVHKYKRRYLHPSYHTKILRQMTVSRIWLKPCCGLNYSIYVSLPMISYGGLWLFVLLNRASVTIAVGSTFNDVGAIQQQIFHLIQILSYSSRYCRYESFTYCYNLGYMIYNSDCHYSEQLCYMKER